MTTPTLEPTRQHQAPRSSTPDLFTPVRVGRYTLANRVIMAPMTRNRAGAGHVPTELMATYYAQRATAGLIVTEATQVSPQGVGYPDTPGLHTRDQLVGWKRVTDAVHARGGRIFAQLWHVGRISHQAFQPGGTLPVAPSAVAAPGTCYTPAGPKPYPTPRALETDEIRGVVGQFARGAENALSAGFDGVELHAANSYLIDQFLRDGTNKRADRYGGTVENRVRFLLEVTRAAADVWGEDRVGVRLSPSSTFNDMRDANPRATFGHAVGQLARLGLAYLHLVEPTDADARHGGPGWVGLPSSFFRPLFPGVLITNAGFTLEKAQQTLADGHADAVAWGTLFLANPDLPERFRRRAPLNVPDPATFYGGTAKGYTDYPALGA